MLQKRKKEVDQKGKQVAVETGYKEVKMIGHTVSCGNSLERVGKEGQKNCGHEMRKVCFLIKVGFVLLLIFTSIYASHPGLNSPRRLFDSSDILEVKIFAGIITICRDRGENKIYHPAKISYIQEDGAEITVDVSIKTRGITRLNPRICNFPPLFLKFKKGDVKNTIFKGIKKLKLVTHCQNKKEIYEEYLLREYLVYKLYNIFTEMSFRVRLAHITYIDTARKSKTQKYGFFIEPVEMMARRNNSRYLEIGDRTDYTLDSRQSSFLSVFQFMIGNTDFSFTADHNVKRILPASGPSIGVPYDFDYAGIVNTHYAVPILRAKTASTKDRFYQGYCQSPQVFNLIFARFQRHKQEIFSLYQNFPLISEKYKKKVFKFLEKFYKIISTPRLIKQYILDNCVQKTVKTSNRD